MIYTIAGLEDDTKFLDHFVTANGLTRAELTKRVERYLDEQRPDAIVAAVIEGAHYEECYL